MWRKANKFVVFSCFSTFYEARNDGARVLQRYRLFYLSFFPIWTQQSTDKPDFHSHRIPFYIAHNIHSNRICSLFHSYKLEIKFKNNDYFNTDNKIWKMSKIKIKWVYDKFFT